jgi:hypothetical protein
VHVEVVPVRLFDDVSDTQGLLSVNEKDREEMFDVIDLLGRLGRAPPIKGPSGCTPGNAWWPGADECMNGP